VVVPIWEWKKRSTSITLQESFELFGHDNFGSFRLSEASIREMAEGERFATANLYRIFAFVAEKVEVRSQKTAPETLAEMNMQG
jgi:hypothetical protein